MNKDTLLDWSIATIACAAGMTPLIIAPEASVLPYAYNEISDN